MKRQPKQDKDGKLYCDICHKAFDRLGQHVRQSHQMNTKAYKLQFGYSTKKGLNSERSAQKLKEMWQKHKTLHLNNLSNNGTGTQFKSKKNSGSSSHSILSIRYQNEWWYLGNIIYIDHIKKYLWGLISFTVNTGYRVESMDSINNTALLVEAHNSKNPKHITISGYVEEINFNSTKS